MAFEKMEFLFLCRKWLV